jgi:hypothetical protein
MGTSECCPEDWVDLASRGFLALCTLILYFPFQFHKQNIIKMFGQSESFLVAHVCSLFHEQKNVCPPVCHLLVHMVILLV